MYNGTCKFLTLFKTLNKDFYYYYYYYYYIGLDFSGIYISLEIISNQLLELCAGVFLNFHCAPVFFRPIPKGHPRLLHSDTQQKALQWNAERQQKRRWFQTTSGETTSCVKRGEYCNTGHAWRNILNRPHQIWFKSIWFNALGSAIIQSDNKR